MWSAYLSIFRDNDSYTHSSVNHSENFIKPVNGTHVESFEALWSRLKSNLRSKFQRRFDLIGVYIDEFSLNRSIRTISMLPLSHFSKT